MNPEDLLLLETDDNGRLLLRQTDSSLRSESTAVVYLDSSFGTDRPMTIVHQDGTTEQGVMLGFRFITSQEEATITVDRSPPKNKPWYQQGKSKRRF